MDARADQAHLMPMSDKAGVLEVLGGSTCLGLTSFGGPIPPSATSMPRGSCHQAGGMLV
jgi:hypothetical protein